jgi:integrase
MTRLRLPYVHEFLDRHGKVHRYFRRCGCKAVRLPGHPGSAEFMTAYQAAFDGMAGPPLIGASRTKPGTVNAAIVGYYQSLAFRSLAPSTQAMRRAILERFRLEHGDKRIAMLSQNHVAHMLSRMGPVAARNWLKTLRGLLDFAIAEGFRADNPTLGIKLPPHKTDGHYAWTEDEIAQFEAHHAIGTKPRLAFALLLDTAQRRSDVIRMGPQHVRNGVIHIRQDKTGTALAIPIYPSLQAVLDGTPCKDLTFLVTRTGRPFSGNDFSEQFRAWCDAAGLPKQCSAHGLRKAAARRLADEGATAHQIAAITGHKSLSEVARYTRAADQARLAREAVELRRREAAKAPTTERRTGSGKPKA